MANMAKLHVGLLLVICTVELIDGELISYLCCCSRQNHSQIQLPIVGTSVHSNSHLKRVICCQYINFVETFKANCHLLVHEKWKFSHVNDFTMVNPRRFSSFNELRATRGIFILSLIGVIKLFSKKLSEVGYMMLWNTLTRWRCKDISVIFW